MRTGSRPGGVINCCVFCFCSVFFKREMELSLVGLQNAGKSSLVNVLTTGNFHEDMIPTVREGIGTDRCITMSDSSGGPPH